MRNSLNKGAVAGGLFGSLAIWIAAGVIFWPGLMMAYNTVIFPGYETCKRGISREMPDFPPYEFAWPPRVVVDPADNNVRRYPMVIISTKPDGRSHASLISCTADLSRMTFEYRFGP
jgi:hypothetical protein